MDILESIKQLSKLIKLSEGKKIRLDSDEEYSFEIIKSYTLSEIEDYGKGYDIKLPIEYKKFLIEIGSCKLYFDEYELGIVFHELEKIEEMTNSVFRGLQSPFPQLLLIGSNLNNGDMIGYNLNKHSNRSLSIFSIAEEYPENWINSEEYITLGQFLSKLIVSDGEDYYL